jgi:hypothetical protein
MAVAREILRAKIEGQARVARRLGAEPSTLEAIERAFEALDDATTPDALLVPEAAAAVAYWDAWRDVPIRFTRVDEARVPAHWHTFGQRRSPVSRTSRLAANPINAMLGYLYAILEAEARIACLAMGLDPALGVLHADLPSRDSLALDVMEAVRPDVDEWALTLLERRVFRARDFLETRLGVCRVMPPLAHELASTGPIWASLLGPVIEQTAKGLLAAVDSPGRALPTPLSGANRALARGRGATRPTRHAPSASRRPVCIVCGADAPGRDRAYCDSCLELRVAEQSTDFLRSGHERLAELRAAGIRPNATRAVIAGQAAKMTAHRQAAAEWKTREQTHDLDFRSDVLPRLAGQSARDLAAATGLSLGYCRRVMKGACVPHPRHWGGITALVGASATS